MTLPNDYWLHIQTERAYRISFKDVFSRFFGIEGNRRTTSIANNRSNLKSFCVIRFFVFSGYRTHIFRLLRHMRGIKSIWRWMFMVNRNVVFHDSNVRKQAREEKKVHNDKPRRKTKNNDLAVNVCDLELGEILSHFLMHNLRFIWLFIVFEKMQKTTL